MPQVAALRLRAGRVHPARPVRPGRLRQPRPGRPAERRPGHPLHHAAHHRRDLRRHPRPVPRPDLRGRRELRGPLRGRPGHPDDPGQGHRLGQRQPVLLPALDRHRAGGVGHPRRRLVQREPVPLDRPAGPLPRGRVPHPAGPRPHPRPRQRARRHRGRRRHPALGPGTGLGLGALLRPARRADPRHRQGRQPGGRHQAGLHREQADHHVLRRRGRLQAVPRPVPQLRLPGDLHRRARQLRAALHGAQHERAAGRRPVPAPDRRGHRRDERLGRQGAGR